MAKIKILIKVDEKNSRIEWRVWTKEGWRYKRQKPTVKQMHAYLANLVENVGKVINPPEIHVKENDAKVN